MFRRISHLLQTHDWVTFLNGLVMLFTNGLGSKLVIVIRKHESLYGCTKLKLKWSKQILLIPQMKHQPEYRSYNCISKYETTIIISTTTTSTIILSHRLSPYYCSYYFLIIIIPIIISFYRNSRRKHRPFLSKPSRTIIKRTLIILSMFTTRRNMFGKVNFILQCFFTSFRRTMKQFLSCRSTYTHSSFLPVPPRVPPRVPPPLTIPATTLE